MTLPEHWSSAGGAPGIPVATPLAVAGHRFDLTVCPTGALEQDAEQVTVVYERCISCLRCRRAGSGILWQEGYRPARLNEKPLPPSFASSLHVRVIDAGDCGACLNEIRMLSNPLYSLHRFGVYITPTPRDADVLIVIGPVTVGMEDALKAAYDAMPEPKRVVAVGACALSGGVFAGSFATRRGLPEWGGIPVDAAVFGCPPPPLAVLEALRKVSGQV